MSKRISGLRLGGAVVLGGLLLAGCATQDYVNQHLTPVQSQVSALQDQARDRDARLAAMDHNSREALDRATAAGVLAQGKFDYAMVLSDDATKFPVNGSTLSDEAKARLTSNIRTEWDRLTGHRG